MEKLTLKEIAGYLPDVEILILNHKCDYVGIEIAKVNGHYFIGEDIYLTYEGGSTGKKLGTECKLILLGLEMLTKTIVHHGVEIIPIHELEKKFTHFDFQFTDYFGILLKIKPSVNLPNQYFMVEDVNLINKMLYEWHFDIFGLLKAGKAIDKSTLNSK